jgi:hypothetical protein
LPPLSNGGHAGCIFLNRRQHENLHETLVTMCESSIFGKRQDDASTSAPGRFALSCHLRESLQGWALMPSLISV